MKKLNLEEFQERLSIAHPLESLEAISWGGDREDTVVKCKACGTIYVKQGGYFLDKRKKSICKICFPTQPNQLKETFKLPDGYSYIDEYKGMQNKILIRHDNCGFIWKVKPNNLKFGKGCPKCNKNVSKGEQAIKNWLAKNCIEYQTQIPLRVEGHLLFIDFYLPKFNLYIEYNGEQHYKKVNFFGGEEKFKRQQENDNLKRQYLKNKLLEIPYTYFHNIAEILESSTTIPNWVRRQALAAEVENLLKENKGE